jgi:IS30 family transposase
LRRNLDPASGQYRPFAAQRMAAARRARPGRGKLACDAELAGFVQEQLRRRWSPEQICHALRERFPDQPSRHLVPETIYQALYRPGSTLRRELPPRVLRTGRSRRRSRRHPNARCGRLVNMTMIDQRPAEVAERSTPGHWEGDLITGASNRSAIGTLVERTSRFTILLHLPADHGAQAVHQAVVAALAVLPASLRRSLTWDQGSEMALHAQISQELGMPVFFCEKASPWQRPSNENTNGLLRQYFPKGTDLRVHSLEQLVAVAAELNARPRKTLGWATPAQRLANLEATAT